MCLPFLTFKTVAKYKAIQPYNGVISWHIVEDYMTKDMDKYKVILAFEKAFKEWQPYFNPIKFESTSNSKIAPIKIYFMNNSNPKLRYKFDESVLAYAFFPNRRSLGLESDMYFNDEINWGEAHSDKSFNLFKVIVHELGHAFGIDHNNIKNDIMYPEYQPNDEVNITEDTKNAINYLYGKYKKEIEQVKKTKNENLDKKEEKIDALKLLKEVSNIQKELELSLEKNFNKIFDFIKENVK